MKIRWCWKDRYDLSQQVCSKLAVLCCNSVVRIYDVDMACEMPTLIIDFKPILGLSTSNSSRSFSIYNYMGNE
ncbi:unnamed protein product [Gongylonema pulchrum]|uniref:Uncharacterized protein n=1 Tax=Gongylonema pulchrum TaxID=637853 RepID=A0A3P7NWK4_9BILA|nr:unnamed protein product [Gongylonema pulchrum]